MRTAVFLLLALAPAASAQLLTDFRPSSLRSEFGTVSQVEFASGLIALEPDALAMHLPQAMMNLRFSERVWIVAYRTGILDAQGETPRENHLCHTFFGDQRVMQTEDQELRGVYSDAFTPEIVLPDGFGVPIEPDEPMHWMPMFNNRADRENRVRMKVTLSLIRQKDLVKPLRPLYGTLRSVEVPHLYFVAPGRDERHADFQMPFDGALHFAGTHIHPYGVYVELYNVTRGQPVWRGNRRLNERGEMVGMETFSSREGYPVHAGETYRVTAVYENPTSLPIDAMAGLYLFFTR